MEKAVENATDDVDFYNLLLHNIEDESSNSLRGRASRWLGSAPGGVSIRLGSLHVVDVSPFYVFSESAFNFYVFLVFLCILVTTCLVI
jgi:hypothetical protein